MENLVSAQHVYNMVLKERAANYGNIREDEINDYYLDVIKDLEEELDAAYIDLVIDV